MQSGDASSAGFTATPGISLRELWRLVATVKKDLPGISTPSLLIHARNDDVASLRNAVYVQKRVSGPTQLLLLDNSYHMITVDQERHKVGDASAVFFHSQLRKAEKEALAGAAVENIPTAIPEPSEAQDADLSDASGRDGQSEKHPECMYCQATRA
jgi:carboxylesterase